MGPGTHLQGWALAHTPGRGQVVFVAGVLASLRVLLPVPFVTGKCEVPWWSQCGLGSPGMLAREKPARTWLEPPMCSPSLVWPVLCCVRGQRSLCAAAGGLRKSGRDVALLGVTPSCSSAVCFGLGIASAAALSGVGLWQRRERQGRSPSALLPKNARMKRAARILSPGRVCSAHTDLVPCGPVPAGAASSGNFVEGEREKRSGFPAPSENTPSHPGRGTALLLQAWAGSSGEGAQAADTGSGLRNFPR